MSISAYFQRISRADMDALIASKERLEHLSFGSSSEQLSRVDRAARCLCLDKAWDAIHFLLTGSKQPTDHLLSQMIYGGTEHGSDTGYGPPRFMSAEQVKSIAEALRSADLIDAAANFTRAELAAASLYGFDAERAEDEIEDLQYTYFEPLNKLFQQAANNNECMLTWMS